MNVKIDPKINFHTAVNLVNDAALEILSMQASDNVRVSIDQFGYGMDDGAASRGYGFVARVNNLMVSVLPYNDIVFLDIYDVIVDDRDVVSVPVSNVESIVSYIRDMLYW